MSLPQTFFWNIKQLTPTRDQGLCTSCWAFSVTDMLADRLTIYTNNYFYEPLSVQYMLSCFSNHFGCKIGGSPEDVYFWASQHGIPYENLYPYEQYDRFEINRCKSSFRSKEGSFGSFGSSGSQRVFVDSKTIHDLCEPSFQPGDSTHQMNIQRMKQEIYINGPIVGTIEVYNHFYQYKSGTIYTLKNPKDKYEGGHSCEILGWSQEKGIPYWLCRCAWGKNWPSRGANGIFKVRLGTNEIGIESRASCAKPIIPQDMINYVPNVIPNKFYTL